MKAPILFATITGMAVIGIAWSQSGNGKEIKKVPVTSSRADSGVEMFKQYCASCHGIDAKGHGPAAEVLKMAPADLTVLKQKNGGKFPSNKVGRVISGADEITAHGSREMPLWGPIFQSLDANNQPVTKLRIVNVTKYIESIQQ